MNSKAKHSKATYETRRQSGRCVRCGAPAAVNRGGKPMSMCSEHLDEASQRTAAVRSKA